MSEKKEEVIGSIEEFIQKVKADRDKMHEIYRLILWFRGQSVDKPLLPKLYRKEYEHLNENNLVQTFRMRAPALGETPSYERIDEWLFLMQHCGLPTRMLDWTEGALIALFFALCDVYEVDKPCPVVWMLNPLALNVEEESIHDARIPLSWIGNEPNHPEKSACPLNIIGAFERNEKGCSFPVALYPQHIHPRVTAQRSCFTVHGKKRDAIEDAYANKPLIKEGYLKKYYIDYDNAYLIFDELRMLGISYSTLFPDFDGLARDLSSFMVMRKRMKNNKL